MTETYDNGLTYAEYRALGKSGTYRADLDRFFTDDMKQPPLPTPKTASQPTDFKAIRTTQNARSGVSPTTIVTPTTEG